MKTKFTLVIFIAFAVCLLTNCKKKTETKPAPVVDFSYTGSNSAPGIVSFTNLTQNATSYTWDFGDGTTATDVSPSHTFVNGGSYTVKLTANGEGGNNIVTKTLTVSAYKIKTSTYYSNSQNYGTDTYTYNLDGSLSKITFSDGSYISLTWATTQVTVTSFTIANAVDGSDVYSLNSFGLAVSSTSTYTNKKNKSRITKLFSKSINSTSTSTYEYDVNNYKIKETALYSDNSSNVSNYTVSNGNVATSLETSTNGSTTNNYSTSYDYFSDKANTIEIENMGISFFGKQNKNIVKTGTQTYNSGSPSITTFIYEFDSKNRVTKQTSAYGTNVDYTIYTYND